ncbi:MAG: TIGR02597 family protein [Verrucomicrobiota bacterium]
MVLAAVGITNIDAQINSTPVGLFKVGAYDDSTGLNTGSYVGLPSNSDTLVSLPFTLPPVFTGLVQSVAGNVITISGSPKFTSNQFISSTASAPPTTYVLVGPSGSSTANPKEGCVYAITANDASTVTLDLNGDVITSIPAGSQITFIPYWTLGTVFPASSSPSFTATTSTRSYKTQILLPNTSAQGTNIGYSDTYFYSTVGTNVGWRLVGAPSTQDESNAILRPGSFFVVRNNNGAPTLPLVLLGTVLPGKFTSPLTTLATQGQDNALSLLRPISVTLNDTGLNNADGSFVATTSTRSIKDQLLVYDNATISQNKSSARTYYFYNGAWRLVGAPTTTDYGDTAIAPGSAITIRKAASGTGLTDFWQNSPTY